MGSWIAKSFKTDLPVRKLAQPTVEVELNWQVSKCDNCYKNLQSCCKNCGLNRPNQHLQIWYWAKKEKKFMFCSTDWPYCFRPTASSSSHLRPSHCWTFHGKLSDAGMCNMFLRRSNCRVTSASISPCINLLLEFPCCRCCVLFSLHPH